MMNIIVIVSIIAGIIIVALIAFLVFIYNKPSKQINKQTKHNLIVLENYIKKLEKKGLKKEAINELLISAGWHKHEVDIVISEMHKPNNKIDELKKFCDSQRKKGRDKEGLKEMLLENGWSEEITDLVLGLDEGQAKVL